MFDAAVLLLCAGTASSLCPALFWNSEGHRSGSTVMALGGGLANATITVCDLATLPNSSSTGCYAAVPSDRVRLERCTSGQACSTVARA